MHLPVGQFLPIFVAGITLLLGARDIELAIGTRICTAVASRYAGLPALCVNGSSTTAVFRSVASIERITLNASCHHYPGEQGYTYSDRGSNEQSILIHLAFLLVSCGS